MGANLTLQTDFVGFN